MYDMYRLTEKLSEFDKRNLITQYYALKTDSSNTCFQEQSNLLVSSFPTSSTITREHIMIPRSVVQSTITTNKVNHDRRLNLFPNSNRNTLQPA